MHVRSFCAAIVLVLAANSLFPARAQEVATPRPQTEDDLGAPLANDFHSLWARDNYFRSVASTTNTEWPPFEIVIQKQAAPTAGYEENVARDWGPWLQALAAQFEKDLAAPAKIAPRDGAPPIRLVVLASEAEFQRYGRSISNQEGMSRAANYDHRLRAIVTFCGANQLPNTTRYPQLRRTVWAMLQQRASTTSNQQIALWLREGLSGYLGWYVGAEPSALDARVIDPSMLKDMVELTKDKRRRAIMLLPIRTLASVGSVSELSRHVQKLGEAAQYTWQAEDAWYQFFLSESTLWMHFLRRDPGSALERNLLDYVAACTRTVNGRADLEKAFPGTDLAQLDREFFLWIYARYRELGRPVDEAALAGLFEAPAPANGPASSKDAPILALAPPAHDPVVQRALALRKLRTGDVSGAIAALEAAVAQAGAGTKAPLQLELDRARAWLAARDSWLEELAASNGRVQLERDGKKLTFKVTKGADGAIALESTKGSDTRSPNDLELVAAASQMKGTPPNAAEWARAYAYVVGGDPRWDKILRDKSDAAAALRHDAASVYPELARVGVAAELLQQLSGDAELVGADAAERVSSRVRQLLAEAPDLDLVKSRLAEVRALAERAAAKAYDESPPTPTFAGQASWVGADVLELRYDFTSPTELDDWPEDADYLRKWRDAMTPITAEEDARKFEVADGVWAGAGDTLRRHILPFDAPMSVRFVTRHGGDPNSVSPPLGFFFLAICDDGGENYIGVGDEGSMWVRDTKTGTDDETDSTSAGTKFIGKAMTFELEHDGATARLSHDGVRDAERPAASRRSGDVLLLVHTSRLIALESIVIRGKVGAEAKKRLRDRWIRAKVRGLGFP
jgi:hypothetical protein